MLRAYDLLQPEIVASSRSSCEKPDENKQDQVDGETKKLSYIGLERPRAAAAIKTMARTVGNGESDRENISDPLPHKAKPCFSLQNSRPKLPPSE